MAGRVKRSMTRLQRGLKELQTVIYGRVTDQGRDLILRRLEKHLKELVEAEKKTRPKTLVIRYRKKMEWQTVGTVKSREEVIPRMAEFIRKDLGMKPEDIDMDPNTKDEDFVWSYFEDGDGSEGYEVEEV